MLSNTTFRTGRYFTQKHQELTSSHLPPVIMYKRQHGSDFDVTSLLSSLSQLTWTSTLDTGSLLSRFDNREAISYKCLPYNHHRLINIAHYLFKQYSSNTTNDAYGAVITDTTYPLSEEFSSLSSINLTAKGNVSIWYKKIFFLLPGR